MSKTAAIRSVAAGLFACACIYIATIYVQPTPWLTFWVLSIASGYLFAVSFFVEKE